MRAPTFFRTFQVGMRFEWQRLASQPVTWFLGGMVLLGGLLLGLFGQVAAWQTDMLGALRLALWFTLVSAFWGHQATAAAVTVTHREVIAARAADEWALHLARLFVTGFYGALISALFFLGATLSLQALEPWRVALRWLPHVILAHTLAAALGGLSALLFARRPGLGVPATFLLWLGWFAAGPALSLSPLWPDLTLNVLRWDNTLQDASAQSLYWPLLASFALAISLIFILGLLAFSALERRHLAPAPLPAVRRLAWPLATALALGLLIASATVRHERETLLLQEAAMPVEAVLWEPQRLALRLRGQGEEQLLEGPSRPTAVNSLEYQRFAPYLGRDGVVLRVARLVPEGAYDIRIGVPESWQLYGCAEVIPTRDEALRCRGEAAERDWLVLLPTGALAREREVNRTLDPLREQARTRIERSIRAIFEHLNLPSPTLLPFGGPFWLSERALSMPTTFGASELAMRSAAGLAAIAISAYLADLRQPEVALWEGISNLPLALLATVDRLIFELGHFDLDPTEIVRRRGDVALGTEPLYPLLPFAFDETYNAYWLATDALLRERGVTSSELWHELAALTSADWEEGAWRSVLAQRWNMHVAPR